MRARDLQRVTSHFPAERGFTLVEVLVSILLVSLGVVGMLGALAQWVPNSTDAENRNRAALVANQLASQMWANQTVTGCTGTTPTDPLCNYVVTNIATTLPGGAVAFNATTATSTQIVVTWTTPGTRFSGVNGAPQAQYITQVMLP